MNSASSNSGQSGCKFGQTLVNQTPRYDNGVRRRRMVQDRKLKIQRPRKQTSKWL